MNDLNVMGEFEKKKKNNSFNMFQDLSVNSIMRRIVTALDTPVKVVLIIMLIITIIMVSFFFFFMTVWFMAIVLIVSCL